MNDYSYPTVSSTINAFEKSVKFPFKPPSCLGCCPFLCGGAVVLLLLIYCSLLHHQEITQNDVYHRINDVTNVPVYLRLKQDYINFFLQAKLMYLKFASKSWCHFVSNIQRYGTISTHVPNVYCNLLKKKLQYTGMASKRL